MSKLLWQFTLDTLYTPTHTRNINSDTHSDYTLPHTHSDYTLPHTLGPLSRGGTAVYTHTNVTLSAASPRKS